MAHLGECPVELREIVTRGVCGDVGLRVDEIHLHLQGRVAEQTQELRLRHILDRHEVQNEDAQRADVLPVRARRIHDEYVFALKDVRRRQIVRYLDWHYAPFPFL